MGKRLCLVLRLVAAVLVVQSATAATSAAEPTAEIEVVTDFETAAMPKASWRLVLWPIHAAAMILGGGQLVAAFLWARRRHRDPGWFARHRLLGLNGPLALLLGAFVAWRMVGLPGAGHVQGPHGLAGVVTLALVLLVPLIGLSLARAGAWRACLARLHVWTGRLALLALVLVAVFGFLQPGLF